MRYRHAGAQVAIIENEDVPIRELDRRMLLSYSGIGDAANDVAGRGIDRDHARGRAQAHQDETVVREVETVDQWPVVAIEDRMYWVVGRVQVFPRAPLPNRRARPVDSFDDVTVLRPIR